MGWITMAWAGITGISTNRSARFERTHHTTLYHSHPQWRKPYQNFPPLRLACPPKLSQRRRACPPKLSQRRRARPPKLSQRRRGGGVLENSASINYFCRLFLKKTFH